MDRVWETEESSTKRDRVSRVAARMIRGARRQAGQGRLAATPKGMWWAFLAEVCSQRSGSKASGSWYP